MYLQKKKIELVLYSSYCVKLIITAYSMVNTATLNSLHTQTYIQLQALRKRIETSERKKFLLNKKVK